LIDARGTAEPQGVSTMFYTMIENILANVTGGVSLPVEYPAAASQNTTSGEKFVVDTIAHGLRHCPHQKYALFGYSQGATLILKVLRQLSPSALESVKSVVLVGNPYRLPGKISNVDATAQHDERASVGMFAEEAIADNKPIPQLSKDMDQSGKVLDYCLAVSIQINILVPWSFVFPFALANIFFPFTLDSGRFCLFAQPCLFLPDPSRSPVLWPR
jgi:pimeloyl-ACP methyl ester carboxylesterase